MAAVLATALASSAGDSKETGAVLPAAAVVATIMPRSNVETPKRQEGRSSPSE